MTQFDPLTEELTTKPTLPIDCDRGKSMNLADRSVLIFGGCEINTVLRLEEGKTFWEKDTELMANFPTPMESEVFHLRESDMEQHQCV